MNVLLLIDTLNRGGAETHLLTLAEQLCRNGVTVTVASLGGTLEHSLAQTGATPLHFPAPLRAAGVLPNARWLRRLLRTQHFDIVHAHTRRTALLCRLATLRPLPLPPSAAPLASTYRRRGLRRALQPLRVVTAHAKFAPRCRSLSFWGDATVAVSEDIRAHLQTAFALPAQRATVIPNGIDLALFRPSSQPHDPTTLRLTFASRLDADCSMVAEQLLSLAPRLAAACRERGARLQLTILGGGDRLERLRALAAQIEARADVPRVLLPGGVDDPWCCFSQSDVFVGVSRAALEALACGCTVVLAGNEGYGGVLHPQDFFRHAKTNFCCRNLPPPTEEKLLAALCALMDQPASQKETERATLRALVEQHCSAEQMGARTLALYRAQLRQRRRLCVAVVGYFGRGNLGDQAILRQLRRRFQNAEVPSSLAAATPRSRLPSTADPPLRLQLCVLSAQHKKESTPTVEGLPALPRGSLWRRLMLLCRADALLLGGGTLLQNASRHGNRSLLYYLSLLLLARLCGCPASLRANGVGPLRGAWARALTGFALRGAADISLRESASAHLLRRCGIPTSRLSLCPDPVLDTQAEDAAITLRRLASVGLDRHTRYLCIIPRPIDSAQQTALISLARAAAEAQGLTCLLLPLSPQEDGDVCRSLARVLGAKILCCPDEQAAAGVLRRAAAVLSLRLHGLILARGGNADLAALAIPSTAPKLRSFVQEYGGTYREL